MDLVNILRIIHPRASLYNIRSERSLACIDPLTLQILAPSQCGGLCQTQVLDRPTQVLEREVWLLIHLQKGPNSALHQPLRPYGRRPVFPQHFRHIPPSTVTTSKDPVLSIVDSQRLLEFVCTARVVSLGGETEFIDCGDDVLVDFHKYAGAKLDWFRREAMDVDGC